MTVHWCSIVHTAQCSRVPSFILLNQKTFAGTCALVQYCYCAYCTVLTCSLFHPPPSKNVCRHMCIGAILYGLHSVHVCPLSPIQSSMGCPNFPLF